MAHDGQTLHHKVKAPGDHAVHLTLSVSTTINDGPTHIHPGISIEPLLAQHSDEGGKERGGKTRVKDGLDVDDSGIRAGPFREIGVGTGWGLLKQGVCDDLEEGIILLLNIWLKLVLDIEDESGCYSREQAGLFSQKKGRN